MIYISNIRYMCITVVSYAFNNLLFRWYRGESVSYNSLVVCCSSKLHISSVLSILIYIYCVGGVLR